MRKIIVAQYISLDGVVESPERWHFPYVSDEFYAAMWAVNARIDTMLLGRVTYDALAATFANAPQDDPVAAQLNRPAKVVVSSSLCDPAWARTSVLTGHVAGEVAALKARPGDDILVIGSIQLTRALLRAGLIDELHLFVHPVIVGAGQRLFEDAGPKIALQLAGTSPLPNGVTYATYQLAA